MNQNNKQTEKKNKLSFSDLLKDKRFMLFFSCLLAFVLWTWVAIEKSPETQRVITGVPVQINLENSVPEQLGLSVFGNSEFTIDVTVKGKKYITSSISADDIDVIANTNYVDGSGIKTLQIKVTPKDSNADYVISSYSSNYVEVYFDTYKEVELPLVGVVETDMDSIVPDGCIAGDTVLSKNTVLITGPTTEVNKITSVTANVTIDKVLEKTTVFDPIFNIVTNDDSSLEYVNGFKDSEPLICCSYVYGQKLGNTNEKIIINTRTNALVIAILFLSNLLKPSFQKLTLSLITTRLCFSSSVAGRKSSGLKSN